MRPTDVLAYRRILYDQARECLSRGGFEDIDWDDLLSQFTHEGYVDTETCTSQSEVYYVSSDMCAVAKAAAESLPDEELRVGDVPASVGFLVFDRPIHTDADGGTIEGAMWREFDEGYWCSQCDKCIECDPARDRQETPPHVRRGVRIYPLARSSLRPNQLFPVVTYNNPVHGEPEHPMEWEYDTWATDSKHAVVATNDAFNIALILRATWTIMQQSLSISVRTQVDRAERRRSIKAGLRSDVLVVRLRRKSLDGPHEEGREEGVEWSHRWLVSGHWRNQWLPSRVCHRLQWISGHVKGPADKPLVVKDRVTAWIR